MVQVVLKRHLTKKLQKRKLPSLMENQKMATIPKQQLLKEKRPLKKENFCNLLKSLEITVEQDQKVQPKYWKIVQQGQKVHQKFLKNTELNVKKKWKKYLSLPNLSVSAKLIRGVRTYKDIKTCPGHVLR